MADDPAPRKKKLPPLSQQETETNGDAVKRVKKKKKKPPAEAAEGGQEAEVTKPTPQRRKKTTGPSERGEAPDESVSKPAATDTPKKKKRTKPKTDSTGMAADEQPDEQPESSRSRVTADEDVTGSKASLVTKGSEGTPKKRVKKKKKKAPADDDNFLNGTLAADLAELVDDVVVADPAGEKKPRVPHYSSNPVLRSQATDKLYVERNAGFKWLKKDDVAKMEKEQKRPEDLPQETKAQTTIEFGLATFKVFKAITLFVHGLTAGISFWQILLIYVLAFTSDLDLLTHFQPLGLPIQSLYYILLVLCCVSTADRYDIASPNKDFMVKAVTLQNGAISLVIYMASLILSLSLMSVEDKIYLYGTNSTLWADPQTVATDITLWKNLNIARGVTAILAWLVLSIFPNDDRLTTNLTSSDDMEKDLEMNAVSMA